MSTLFSGTIHFVHVTFATPGQNFSVSSADMQTMLAYAQHAIVPIQEWTPQYGPSAVTISPTILEFTANMSSTAFADSDLQGWVNTIVSNNGFDPSSTAIVVPCPQQISESSGGIGANSGYHFIANVPYAVWGMGGTGITLADNADVYAMVVSHELAEMIVDPQANDSNPETGDPCCENCLGTDFYRAYFDSFNDYLGTNQQSPPGGFNFAYYTAVVVKPEGGGFFNGDCHATVSDCDYAPVVQNFYFVINKDDYGRDEVTDTPTWPLAFYLFLDGFSPNAVGASIPALTGSFNSANIPGLSITHTGTTFDIGSAGDNGNLPQRIRFAYQVQFTNASLAVFPNPGNPPEAFTLAATLSVQGQNVPFHPQGEFFLLSGADPYFTNINASNNQFYLSQDLRVFTVTPAVNPQPVPVPGQPALADSVPGAYNYISQLITHLNQTYGYLNPAFTPPDTNVSDPLDSLFPSQFATDGDSLVTQKSGSNNNYNFAIARVRLKGSPGSQPANNVKVFFRIFTSQTFDTDFIDKASAVTSADPNVTYPSSGSPPQGPLPGTDGSNSINGSSLPFFANNNFASGPTDYTAGGPNNQTITIPPGQDYAWAFFGCFLNVWDTSNTFAGKDPQQWLPGSGHVCLVAQIAYDDAPIINANGVIETPENSDKLAQRNLQVTPSGNPGFPATHRVPQTIDVRPSPPAQSTDTTSILSYPDEMMIDWGKTPIGSVANIYWPGVSASSVLQLAATFYGGHMLTAADAHTIQCKVVSPITFVPIPAGAGGSFAGLFTVDLPNGISVGQEFDIVVRRITTKQIALPPPPPQLQRGKAAPQSKVAKTVVWRYITGSFLVRIPVEKEHKILPVDENLLAVLKWRLGFIGTNNRWYPVLLRWISQLSGRIIGMGGDPGKIPPSPNGYQPPPSTGHGEPGHPRKHCYTGKVAELLYNCFGEFEGFELETCCCERHSFRVCGSDLEKLIHRAWLERFTIMVCACAHDAHKVESVALLRAPRPA
jgi:hypothetical protein